VVCYDHDPSKMAEPQVNWFGMWTLVGTRNNLLDGALDPPLRSGSLGGYVSDTPWRMDDIGHVQSLFPVHETSIMQ